MSWLKKWLGPRPWTAIVTNAEAITWNQEQILKSVTDHRKALKSINVNQKSILELVTAANNAVEAMTLLNVKVEKMSDRLNECRTKIRGLQEERRR